MSVYRTCRMVVVIGAIVSSTAAGARAATLAVHAGDDLQAAIDRAQPGDVLLLDAGATFTGNFVLPVKPGAAYITIRSAASDATLPGPGVRMTPAAAALLPKIQSVNSTPPLVTAAGAHHWRLQFLEFPATFLGYGEIIRIGDASSAQSTLAQVPYEFDLDRLYIHGHPLYGQKRGIALNGRSVTIHNSYIADVKAVGFDSQAIGGWNGPGPFTIENNYLEAAGENVLLGGADPTIPNLVSENIQVRFNQMTKPVAWRDPAVPSPGGLAGAGSGSGGSLVGGVYGYRVVAWRQVGGGTVGRSNASPEAVVTVPAGASGKVTLTWSTVAGATEYRVYGRTPGAATQSWSVTGTTFTDTGTAGRAETVPAATTDLWSVKNLFELKNARHVIVEYNLFENNWAAAQKGYAILFTPRNQDGGCPWCVVEDVTFQYNLVRNVAAGINILGIDSPNVSAQTNNIRVLNNVFYGITTTLGGQGWFCLIGDEPRDITIEHNTVDFDGTTAVYAYGGTDTNPRKITGFRFANNALRHGQYGINGAGSATGTTALTAYFPGAVVQGNWLQGGIASRYPAGNFFSGTFAAAFLNLAGSDYRPAAGSVLLTGSTDGLPIGADVTTVMSRVPASSTPATLSSLSRPGGVRIIR